MKMTRDVITDLWPVYEAGEASADTRRLVEEFLQQDPEFARMLREAGRATIGGLPPSLPPDRERATLVLAQTLIRRRMFLLAAAIACMGLASTFTRFPQVTGTMMWGHLNVLPLSLLAVATGLWVAYFQTQRRLRVKGL